MSREIVGSKTLSKIVFLFFMYFLILNVLKLYVVVIDKFITRKYIFLLDFTREIKMELVSMLHHFSKKKVVNTINKVSYKIEYKN